MLAKVGGFVAGMDQAARASDKFKRQSLKDNKDVQAAYASTGTFLTEFSRGLVGALSVGAITAFGKAAIDSLDALNDIADATGSSVEKISGLADVARRTGGDIELVETALVKLNKSLSDSKPSPYFKQLGLDVEALKQLDPVDAFEQLARALAQVENSGLKARATEDLLGKSFKELAPLLKDVAESGGLVAKVTAQQAEEAEKFNKELFGLKTNIGDAARELVSSFLPALNTLFTEWRRARQEAGGSLLDGLFGNNAQSRLTNDAQRISQQIGDTVAMIERLQESQRRDPTNAAFSDARIDKLRAKLLDLQKQAAATTQQLKDLADINAPQSTDRPGSFVGPPIALTEVKEADKEAERAAKRRADEALAYLNRLEDQLNKTRELTAVEQLRFDIEDKRIKLTRNEEIVAVNLAEQIDLVREKTEADKENVRAIEAARDATEDYDKALQRLNEELQRDLKKNAEETDNIKSAADELGLTFASAFEDAIVEGKKFSDVLKGLYQDILRIIIRRQVTEPLANWISSMIPARAMGGPVAGGQTYLVGEQGPELFTPNSAGMITPNGALTAGGGGGPVSVQIINQTSKPVTGTAERTDDGGLRVFIREVVSAVAGDMRAGGETAGAVAQITGANRQTYRR